MRQVIAIGGNALLTRGEVLSAQNQRRNMENAAQQIAQLIGPHQTAIVHGNGPQIGLLALEADLYKEAPPYPLDILGAESQGMIGYIIELALCRVLRARQVATLLTQTRIDTEDPAMQIASKPIGPVYDEATARQLAAERGWKVRPDGNGFRRVVPSPEPAEIVQMPVIKELVERGIVTICAGGGGIPVARRADGGYDGVEAVIDKDLTAANLALALGAERLIILTDVDGVYENWGGTDARKIDRAAPAILRRSAFAPGSMGPKVEAACRFAEATGHVAIIGALNEAAHLGSSSAGTLILKD